MQPTISVTVVILIFFTLIGLVHSSESTLSVSSASPTVTRIASVKIESTNTSSSSSTVSASLSNLHTINSPRGSNKKTNFHQWDLVPTDISRKYSSLHGFLKYAVEDMKKDLVDKKIAEFQFSASTPIIDNIYDHIHVAGYEDSDETKKHFFIHLFLDPRVERLHDGHHADNNNHDHASSKDKIFSRSSAVERFWIPSSSSVKNNELIVRLSPKSLFRIPLVEVPSTRCAKSQATTASPQPELITINSVGPATTQYSFVFLSAGYLASQRDMFIKNVTDLVEMIGDPRALNPNGPLDASDGAADIHASNPFSKYWSFWNAYAVFEPSAQQGASRPKYGLTVNNNLKCVHPAEIERAVSCDRELSIALAAVSPAPINSDPERVVIINVVNTHIYGGSAIYIPGKLRLGSFFNGFDLADQGDYERMLSLTIHEKAHALGDLMDKYSVGVSEPSGRYIRNCQVQDSPGVAPVGASLQWSSWVDAQRSAGGREGLLNTFGNGLKSAAAKAQWGVLEVPQSICGFTNYYKPNDNCLMHRLNDFFMCPVCRMQSTLSVMRNHFEIHWPRFPFRDQVLVIYESSFASSSFTDENLRVINTSSTVVLHLNRVLTSVNGYQLNAYDIDNTEIPITSTELCPACIFLDSDNFAKYPKNTEVKIKVDITDTTNNFLLPNERSRMSLRDQLVQSTYFRLVVVDQNSGADIPRNVSQLLSSTSSANTTSTSTSAAASSDFFLFFNYSSTLEMRTQNYPFGVDQSDMTARVVLCLHSNVTFENRMSQSESEKNASFCQLNARAARPYERPADLAGLLVTFDVWVPIGSAALGIVFLALWLWSCNHYSEESDGKIRLIFTTELGLVLKIIRYVMLGAAVLILIVSLGAVGVSIYIYYNASVLGKILVVGGILISALLYFYAFLGFWAVMSRSTKMLVLNAFCLAIPLGALIWLLIILQSLGTELEISGGFFVDITGGRNNNQQAETTTTTTTTSTTAAPDTTTATSSTTVPSTSSTTSTTTTDTSLLPAVSTSSTTTTTTTLSSSSPPPTTTPTPTTTQDPEADTGSYIDETITTPAPQKPREWMLRIRDFWIWLVANEQEWACSLQGMLECSGFYTSCSGRLGSTSTCPKNCEQTNERYFSPCQTLIRQYIVDHYNLAILSLAITVCVLGLAFILNLVNLLLLWRQKKQLQQQQAERIKRVEAEMAKRRAAYSKQQGTIVKASDNNKPLFLLRSLEGATRRTLIREIKRQAMAKGGSFQMSKKELFSFFQQSMGYSPTKKELDEIFELADTVKEGVLSIKEFLVVFGWPLKEFKMVPAPPPPKSVFKRAAEASMSLTRRGMGSSLKEKKSDDKEEEMMSSKKNNNNSNSKYKYSKKEMIADFEGDMLESEGESDDSDDDVDDDELLGGAKKPKKIKTEESPLTKSLSSKQLLHEKRAQMRRRSSVLLGGDIVGESPAATPQATSLQQPREKEVVLNDNNNNSNLKPLNRGNNSNLLAALSAVQQHQSQKDELGSPGILSQTNRSTFDGQETTSSTNESNNNKNNNAKIKSFGNIHVPPSKNSQSLRHSASHYSTNEHSLFAVPPPPRPKNQVDVEDLPPHQRPPPVIFGAPSNNNNTSHGNKTNINNNNNKNQNNAAAIQQQLSASVNPLANNSPSPPKSSFRQKPNSESSSMSPRMRVSKSDLASQKQKKEEKPSTSNNKEVHDPKEWTFDDL